MPRLSSRQEKIILLNSHAMLNGFTFSELFQSDGLLRLDQAYLASLSVDLRQQLLDYRADIAPENESELLIILAQHLENFLIQLFNIEKEAADIEAKTIAHNPVFAFKKFFVLRRAKKLLAQKESLPPFNELNDWLDCELKKFPLQTDDKELAVGLLANQYLTHPDQYVNETEKLTAWCVQAMNRTEVAHWTSFRLPQRIDYANLVKPVAEENLTLRDGFKLTDPRMNAREAQDEAHYCIYCHDNQGDFCSKGFPVKKNEPQLGLKKNPLDLTLTGCPLDEKISEMHFLKRDGHTLAALAMVMVDNPMCPATGHRICNDCMKACIYQKQDPVNTPQVETRVLTDVLNLPWGVEIYDLLTRWNPLRKKQWRMKPYNGLKVLIAGMGPAGFTLAHHLLQEGFAVVGFDGLKIEPLPAKLLNEPIHRFEDIVEALDERKIAGFGGVAEYGITARWDKNFLKLIYLSLMRRPTFQVFGSARFGGTVTVNDAWEMGFDHFAVAVGAGLPKALSIPGSLAPGMRQANDFLMALQLGNAAKASSLTNLQVRLPAVVIGGGLTGVDTATEVQAYYITQVEKTLTRCEILGEQVVRDQLDPASIEILDEFLAHGRAVRDERKRAAALHEKPNFIKLIRQWGGVTIVYRRTLQESPAYIYNHEELQKAFEEGIYYRENLRPQAVDLNQWGHTEKLICHPDIEIPAHSIFVATGTQPNTAYEFEHRGTFTRVGFQYQHYEDQDGALHVAEGVEHCKDPLFGPFTSYQKHDRRVSLIGDTHPIFHGSVVKAIASGMRTYPKILALLKNKLTERASDEEYRLFAYKMAELFKAEVTDVKRQTEKVIELTIKAPLAAKHFQPGQFYRLQNYETHAPLQMEPLALIAAGADQHGSLKFIVIEKGASSKLCALLKPGEPVSLMGPTGVRAKISMEHETILIIGNQMSLAFLLSYGFALRHAKNRVIFVGIFQNKDEVYNQHLIEQATDQIIWVIQSGEKIPTSRAQDMSATGDYLDVLLQYANANISLHDVDRVYLIGDTTLLRSFQTARQHLLKNILLKNPIVRGSVYSSMQCMLKGVCAQCLQWQIDPETGKRTKAVFACSWPDQPLELIDFDNLDERQSQNKLQERLSALWVDHLLK